jgi:hypothetical protein
VKAGDGNGKGFPPFLLFGGTKLESKTLQLERRMGEGIT